MNRKPVFPWLFVSAAAMVFAGGFINQVRDEVQPPVRAAGVEAHETHAAASLLGQFRTSVSSALWVRTDLYLHNGVEMRPLTDQEKQSGRKGVGSSDNKEGDLHDDTATVTVVPSKQQDFRGIFGDVERATKAYKDMTNHGHNNPAQALPLYRLMTWLDPQFIPAWTTGAHVISWQKSPQSLEKAIAFLEEGRAKNPWSVAIPAELGTIYVRKGRQLEAAQRWYEDAIAKAGSNPRSLPEEELEALQEAYRFLGLIQSITGQLKDSYETGRRGTELFPDDVVLQRTASPVPYAIRDRKAAAKAQDER